ncbi:27862_t:CDS:2, partial [Gigaspora margarita]
EPEGKPKMIIEVLIEHDRLKNWEKLKGGEVWYINQLLDPMGKRLITWQQNSNTRKVKEEFKTQSPNSLALKPQHKPISKKRSKHEWSSSKNEKQTGERSSNKVKYTRDEMNLQLEPDYFVKREKGSSISSKQVRSLRSRKEEIRVVIKEPNEVDVPTRVKRVMTEKVWIKKEEEILKSIKKELRQKDKIALGLNKLREVFILRNIKEYEKRYIEWSRGFLADKIGSFLERMNVSKNKARDIAAGTGEKETLPNDKKPKRCLTEVLCIAKEEVYKWIGQ